MTSTMQEMNGSAMTRNFSTRSMPEVKAGDWVTVCQVDDLVTDGGICALVEEQNRQQQVAIFALANGDIHAVSNFDPIGGASVLSRGITGSLGEEVVVASPLYKHHYNLQTGQCLEDESVKIRTWPVRKNGDCIQLQLA